MRNFDAVQTLFSRATEQLGPPDVVIAGAAGNFMAHAVSISANGFKTVVDIDLLGTYYVFRAGFDVVRKPGGSLIAITAPQAVQPLPQQVHVCAAKAGVNMVVKVLAMEWGLLEFVLMRSHLVRFTEPRASSAWRRATQTRRRGSTNRDASLWNSGRHRQYGDIPQLP